MKTLFRPSPVIGRLNQEDIALFFKLWFALTYSINCKHKIVPPFKKPAYEDNEGGYPFLEIRKELWKNPALIDEFLAEDDTELSFDEKAILASWRTHFISDNFIVLKYFKQYSVFMPSSNPTRLYGVLGISDSIEMQMRCVLPRMVETTLLPFKGKIIFDSLMIVSGTQFSNEEQAAFVKDYKRIKAESGIVECINSQTMI
ncbi:MAG: hypothetical protein LBU89_02425 [Fibromonadaceae bacterium]|jgi:hypothetical protein|nr:hypothetical protein [Fibromonadaceae bacterium]